MDNITIEGPGVVFVTATVDPASVAYGKACVNCKCGSPACADQDEDEDEQDDEE